MAGMLILAIVFAVFSAVCSAADMGVTPIKSAAELFSSIDSMPSCSKIATMALISSCDQLTSDDGNQLTDLQSLYAVRLAICELELVDAEMPVECSNFSPTRDMIHKITLMSTIKNGLRAVFTYHPTGYDTAAQSKLCARALQNHGTGTGWTSYSNNLQNAGNICKAKKMDLLADEILKASEFLHESKTAFNDSIRDMIKRTTTFTTDLAKQDKDVSAYFDQINLLFAFLNNYTAAAGNAVQSLKPINDMTGQLNLNMQTALANSGSDGVLGRIWQISSDLSLLRGDLSDYQEEVHNFTQGVKHEFDKTREALREVREGVEDLPTLLFNSFLKSIFSLPRYALGKLRAPFVAILNSFRPALPILLGILLAIFLALRIRRNLALNNSRGTSPSAARASPTQTGTVDYHLSWDPDTAPGAQLITGPVHSSFAEYVERGEDDDNLPLLMPTAVPKRVLIQELD